MNRALLSLACATLAVVLGPACQGSFPTIGQGKRIVVSITQGDRGSADNRLPLSVVQTTSFSVHVEAQLPDGSVDTAFKGFVGISVQPGTVADLDARNIQLNAGAADVVVPVLGAFGDARIWAEDLGYEPASPNGATAPQCSDGIDNNKNGLIDYPADPGCYAVVDNTEALGEYGSGASDTLYFQLPRISFVRGFDPSNNGNGNATYFPHEQVSVDTGWRGGSSYAFSTVVIGLTSAGFYAQDLQNDLGSGAPGYGGIYAYNFSTPPLMRVCDRLQALGGTSSDFYGFTELNYPTWQLEYYNKAARPCLVPEPTDLGPGDVNNLQRMWQVEATLARVQTAGTVTVHVATDFGPANVPLVTPAGGTPTYTPNATSSNCDFDHSGKIDFTDPQESACAAACDGTSSAPPSDFECSEYSQYASQNAFELIVTDSSSGARARMQANASATNTFNPLANRGQSVRSFTGLVSYFSGGEQFTLNARCDDDILGAGQTICTRNDLPGPCPSDRACVHERTVSQINDNSQ